MVNLLKGLKRLIIAFKQKNGRVSSALPRVTDYPSETPRCVYVLQNWARFSCFDHLERLVNDFGEQSKKWQIQHLNISADDRLPYYGTKIYRGEDRHVFSGTKRTMKLLYRSLFDPLQNDLDNQAYTKCAVPLLLLAYPPCLQT